MANPVVHFEVIGKDPDALRSFYTGLFDWKLQDVGGPTQYATVDTGKSGDGEIGGGIGGVPEGYDGHVTFYVQVDDMEATLAKVEELGGKRTMGPERMEPSPEIGAFIIGTFTDPEGRTIGLYSDA